MVDALYIHVPFCHAKCLYCDFDSKACRDAAAFDAYVRSMVVCIERLGASGVLASCRTAYIGGGTPSVLGKRLVEIVRAVRAIAPALTEFSCEANPESFTADLARALAAAGATRVSLGVQTFNGVELRALGRLHSAQDAKDAIAAARAAGLLVSIDLMCGISLQTKESWRATLDSAVACGVDHVSVYPLTIEDGTPLARKVARGALDEPDEDLQAWCMKEARRVLGEAAFAPYEVASYACGAHACAHNIAYWTGANYLGLGRSAASMLDHAAYEQLRAVLGAPPVSDDASRIRFVQADDTLPGPDVRYEVETLAAREAAAEDLMLSMRMTCGAGGELIVAAERVLGQECVQRAIDCAIAQGLATWVPEESIWVPQSVPFRGRRRLVPTEQGWLLGNELFGLFWDCAGC